MAKFEEINKGGHPDREYKDEEEDLMDKCAVFE